MSALRLVYDADAPPRAAGVRLLSVEELERLLRARLAEHYDGELLLRGHDTARIILFQGTIAWVRCNAYPEHLGDVLQRELALPVSTLRQAMSHCRETGQRLGEGMLELGLLTATELRGCLYRHISDQLLELLAWPGPVQVEQSQWPHRYDPAFTFELDALLRQPPAPTADQQQRLDELVQRCRQRLPELDLVCVIEGEEGTLVHASSDGDPSAQDLLGLALVGVRRLLANRATRHDGEPGSMVLTADDSCLVIEPIAWHPEWLLVLGGTAHPGRLLTVAQTAVRA